MVRSTCPACTQELADQNLKKGSYQYLVCNGCGSATLVDGWMDASYDRGYFVGAKSGGYYNYQADEALHRATGRKRLAAVESHVSDKVRLVDVGSALGYTLDEAIARGWNEAIGVEVSKHAAAVARDRGHRLVTDLDDLDPSGYDGVIFGQVLEHMPDPNTALSTTYRLLDPGGVVFIETWDIESKTARRFGDRWQQIFPPSVVHLFSSRGLITMLERHGFEVVTSGPWTKKVSFGGYLGVVVGKIPGWLGTPLMWVANITRMTRIAIPYRFDDLIAVTARKPTE